MLSDAEINAQQASEQATNAAREAEVAASAALASSVAQSQLIAATMEAGREDAQSSAEDASIAASEAEDYADKAATTNALLLGQFQRFHDEIISCIEGLKEEIASIRTGNTGNSEQQPEADVVSISTVDQQTESVPEEDGEENPGEQPPPGPSGRKRRVGRH